MPNRLEEYCLNITDGEHGSVKNDPNGSYFLLANENMENGQIIFGDNDRKISEEAFKTINKRCQIEKNDVLISTVGTLGKVAVITDDHPIYVFQRSVGIIKPNPAVLDSNYLKYLLMSPHMQKKLTNNSKGAVQKCIFIDDLKNLEVDIPNIDIQKKVVHILVKLDEKIALNRKIIEKLISLGDEMFTRWFLDFQFPNEKGKPYKEDKGIFEDNEILKTQIPHNWKVINIKELCQLIWGQCPDGENILPLNANPNETMLYCSGAGDMRNGLVVDCQARTNDSKREANKYDILMSIAGSIGALCICDKNISIGRAALAFRTNENNLSFVYFIIKKYIDRMQKISSGSVQKVINDSHIEDINFAYNESVIKKFSFTNELIHRAVNISKEILELTRIRDELIPLAINGQIE